MSALARRTAAVWQAFAAGMFSDAVVHTHSMIPEVDTTEEEAREQFVETHEDLMTVAGVTVADALRAYDAGRLSMRETRAAGELLKAPKLDEDGPPLQLTGKPDRSLS